MVSIDALQGECLLLVLLLLLFSINQMMQTTLTNAQIVREGGRGVLAMCFHCSGPLVSVFSRFLCSLDNVSAAVHSLPIVSPFRALLSLRLYCSLVSLFIHFPSLCTLQSDEWFFSLWFTLLLRKSCVTCHPLPVSCGH